MNARCSIAVQEARWLALFAVMLVVGCGDEVGPGDTPATGSLEFSGGYDAGFQEFALVAAAAESSLADHFAVELVTGGLQLDPTTQRISVQVAIHNLGMALHPPVVLWLQEISPLAVALDNPDLIPVAGHAFGVAPPAAGYDYSELLGDDAVLASGETSRCKLWRLRDPILQSFVCTGRIDAGLTPGVPRLTGRVWRDTNVNGLLDAAEEGATNARVRVDTPESALLRVTVDSEGRFGLPLSSPGSYQLTCEAGQPGAPPFYITPNPLDLVVRADGHGDPQSVQAADFGITWGGGPGTTALEFTGAPLESLHAAPWDFLGALIGDDYLSVYLRFTGCQAAQPWTCYIADAFTPGDPVQVDAVLVHDLQEDCETSFASVVSFPLNPLRLRYEMSIGSGDTLVVNLHDFAGENHPLKFYIRDKDDGK